MLAKLLDHNNEINTEITRFHSKTPPAIKISNYLQRFIKYADLSVPILISIIIYIDRVAERKNFVLNSFTIHRFMIASITCGTKAIHDLYLSNRHYAKVGGISTQELSILEFDFLEMIGWNVVVTTEELQDYYSKLFKMVVLF
jgi:hypothetical protein